MKHKTSHKLIRLPVVIDKTGWPRTTLQNKVKNGDLTKPISIGLRSIAWIEEEIDQVIGAMIAGKSKDEIKCLVKELHKSRVIMEEL